MSAAGGVAATGSAARRAARGGIGRPPWLTRSARRRPRAPAATPSLGRSSARRSPPTSSMRTSRCGRCAAARLGGAVEVLGSAAGRAGQARPLRSLPRWAPPVRGPAGNEAVAGRPALPRPRPRPRSLAGACVEEAAGVRRVAALRHCRTCGFC